MSTIPRGIPGPMLTYVIGHINNLYNTTFWALIQLGGMDATEAEKALKVGTAAISNQDVHI